MTAETWADAPGFPGAKVSDQGRVRSRRGTTLKLTGSPYRMVKLHHEDGGRRAIRVHRLVLLAFVGLPPDGMEGCHNNGDRLDNRLVNLRWDTRSNNNRDQTAHGTHPCAGRTHCPTGHEYTPENTLLYRGWRYCRACQRARINQRRERAAA